MANVVDDRDNRILTAAIKLAQADGYRFITRDSVAREAGVSDGSVNNAFGTMDALKAAVLAEAVSRELLDLIAQGLADRHPAVAVIPKALKLRAAQLILG